MAKAKVRGLEEAIDSIFKRYNSNLKKAMEDAAKQAEEDISWEAKSCLYKYYDNYEPTWYDRTDSLIQAFVPFKKVQVIGDEVVAQAGIIYDPAKLNGVYNSNASEQYRPVDSEWILRNYLNGIHPRTNGYPIWSDELVYNPYIDDESPDDKMTTYIQKYKEIFDKNTLLWFAKRVTRR